MARTIQVKEPIASRDVLILRTSGPQVLQPDQVSANSVGTKAHGLAALPAEWSLPFFVVDANLDVSHLSSEQLAFCLEMAGLQAASSLIIRSSGTSESLESRGHLESGNCSSSNLRKELLALTVNLPEKYAGQVHWIVQEHLVPRRQGHFSNERRLSYEKRDWRIEVEPHDGYSASATSLNVRQWRDGKPGQATRLLCITETDIKKLLRSVAIWGTEFRCRLHFEWLWDGSELFLVQMDVEGSVNGITPSHLLSCKVKMVSPEGLYAFHIATPEDFKSIRKLRNAALYSQMGYSISTFYVLESQVELDRILVGEPSENLATDLIALTQRPLVIRTDGSNVPPDMREMLPRSEELRSGEEAIRWLVEEFAAKISSLNLVGAGLILVCHHFIPSVASAWARAEPRSPIVRVEALWGIPEGLYWHPHDTYEVDLGDSVLNSSAIGTIRKVTKRIRFKGVFVGPDSTGKWIYQKTQQPYDWSETIADHGRLHEIARTTKLIAQELGVAASVMWFIDNHPSATKHSVLPWYHEESRLTTPKAVPQRKFKSSSDFTIETLDDLPRLVAIPPSSRIERVLVEPTDHRLIRDPNFAKELAIQSKTRGFVIELAGGVLSHIFYILQREGARVECVDLFGEMEEKTEFYKVVRDKVPSSIEDRGESAHVVTLVDDALIVGLRQKLVEEACETLDASSSRDIVGELADVLEVVRAIAGALGISIRSLESTRRRKRKSKGGFEEGYMLTNTETPHSLQNVELGSGRLEDDESAALRGGSSDRPRSISVPSLIPTASVLRRPDLRHVSDLEVEKLLSVEAGISRLNAEVWEVLQFDLPGICGGSDDFLFSLSLRREGGSIRAVVRLKREERQLVLPFEG